MEKLIRLAELISCAGAVFGAVTTVLLWIRRIVAGQRCQLRAEMLRLYYKHRTEKQIRQYEAENLTEMYKAYKALKGNSFIDIIHDEMTQWEIIS